MERVIQRSISGWMPDEHWFNSLAEARVLAASWRHDYNEGRPHSALDYQTPAEFAARLRKVIPESNEVKDIG